MFAFRYKILLFPRRLFPFISNTNWQGKQKRRRDDGGGQVSELLDEFKSHLFLLPRRPTDLFTRSSILFPPSLFHPYGSSIVVLVRLVDSFSSLCDRGTGTRRWTRQSRNYVYKLHTNKEEGKKKPRGSHKEKASVFSKLFIYLRDKSFECLSGWKWKHETTPTHSIVQHNIGRSPTARPTMSITQCHVTIPPWSLEAKKSSGYDLLLNRVTTSSSIIRLMDCRGVGRGREKTHERRHHWSSSRVEPSRVVVSLLLLYNVKCVIDGRRLRLSCVKGGSFFCRCNIDMHHGWIEWDMNDHHHLRLKRGKEIETVPNWLTGTDDDVRGVTSPPCRGSKIRRQNY